MGQMCLVTGGAGFIGCAISDGLARGFDRVVVLDNLHPQVHKTRSRPAALAAQAELVIGDVTNAEDVRRVLAAAAPDVIIHLAAETGTGQSLTEATRHASVNVVGETVLLDALSQSKRLPEKILLASSRAVYGEGPWRNGEGAIVYAGQRTREQLAAGVWDFPGLSPLPASAAQTRPAPVSVYGATKLAQEHILTSWCNALGVTPIVLRLQNVYGPGQSLTNPYTGIVSLFCQIAGNRHVIPLYEDGGMLRDFILIDDVASAILAALDSDMRAVNRSIDIGTGVATTIGDLASTIAQLYNAPAPEVCAKYRFGDVRHASCNIADSVKALPTWVPEYDVPLGLMKLKNWIENELMVDEQ